MIDQNRLYYLDALKGILIILVVLGHAIQSQVLDYQHDFVFRMIYSFHMPLFFLISGYLTYRGTYNSKLIWKRFEQCIVPFVTWAFIAPFLKTGGFDLGKSVVTLLYPDNGLWFLYNLFVYCVMFNLSERWTSDKRKQEFMLLPILLLSYSLMAILHTKFNVAQICWYFPFFAMGYYMRKYPFLCNSGCWASLIGGGI